MNYKIALILVITAVAACGAGIFVALNQTVENENYRPDFVLKDMNGIARSLGEWDDDVIVLNFWATWCAPCLKEIPMLIELQKEYDNQGLQILGLTLDKKKAAREFARQFQINYPLLGEVESVFSVQDAYGDSRLPYTVVIDRHGNINYTHAGEINRQQLQDVIQPLL